MKHGSVTTYNKGCRCSDCTTVKTEYMRQYQARRKQSDPSYYLGKGSRIVTCPICGTVAEVGRRSIYCSSSCATIAGNGKSGRKSVPPSKFNRCRQCGESVGNSISIYCSSRCRKLQRYENSRHQIGDAIWTMGRCNGCGDSFCTRWTAPARFCSEACNNRTKMSNRRARMRNAYVAEVLPARVFMADGYRCHICKRLTDRTKSVPHPRSPTVDHVIPLACGGTHEPANCRTACFACNSKKADRGGGEQLACF